MQMAARRFGRDGDSDGIRGGTLPIDGAIDAVAKLGLLELTDENETKGDA